MKIGNFLRNKRIWRLTDNSRKHLLFLALILTGVCFLQAPAGKAQAADNMNIISSQDTYEWKYTKAFVGEKDADMKIDGALDEAMWENKQWLTHSEKGVNMRYTAAFTEKGLYIAAIAEDPHIQWNNTRTFLRNSSFRFYVVSNRAEQYFCFDCLSFYVDEKNSSCPQQTRFEAKAVRSTNSNGVPTLTAEFFSTWEDLNYEVNPETGMPDVARIVPMYRYVEGYDSKNNNYLKPIFSETDNDRVRNVLLFGKDGYINADKDGAELGNAGNGYAKSDGWDLSDLDGDADGIKTVRSTVEGGQAIFFKDVYSSRYSYSVDMKLIGGINDVAPTAGVCDMKDAARFNCMRIAGNSYIYDKKIIYHLLDLYESPWHDVWYGERLTKYNSDTINLRVIKDDTHYYYIINGVYEFCKDIDWLGGKTCPGLYTLGAAVEFSNWQVTDYEGSDKDDAFAELVGSYQWTEKVADVSPYTGSERRAPKPADARHKDWLFAGWYEDAACTVPSRTVSGSAYAKYVPAELLSVRCQILAGTSKEKPSDRIRFISTVDSLNYNQVGFDITINGITKSYSSTRVYERIVARDGGVACGYQPWDLHKNAKYFITGTLINIPAAASTTGIRITPWWVTRDGTRVCGVSRYTRVADSYDGIINVPVRLYSDKKAAAGYLETAYNIKDYEFVGYDAGDVFDEVQAIRVGDAIRCIGNVKEMAKDVAMEGMYVNLRFRWIGSGRPQGESVFSIAGEDFCNRMEEDIPNLDVSDVIHAYITPSR